LNNQYLKSNDLFAGVEWDDFFSIHGRPVVVADNLRNPENIGALIRLADNAGASEVVFLGSSRAVNLTRVKRVAASSSGNISWQFIEEKDWLAQLPIGVNLVAIETTRNSTSLFETALPDYPVFVVGNEVYGIGSTILERAALSVHIPVPGPTRSLNVSHAASVVLFEWLRQKLHETNKS
jgi:tRNA G18 (ribose-2'-O)-methylase SpoU